MHKKALLKKKVSKTNLTSLIYLTRLIVIVETLKAIMEALGDRNQSQGTTKNIPWVFFQEYTLPPIETSSRGSYNSQEVSNKFV